MDNNPLFSIVMPVYGVEKYLESGVKSVLAQQEQDFEIILVDDCSHDSSGEICDELAKTDKRITVIHLPENGGLSNARNKGFEKVSGKYVWFMDPDDTVSDGLLKSVKEALEKNPAKITVFGIHEEYFDANGNISYTNDITYGKEVLSDTVDELRKTVIELEKKTLYGYAWNKIYDVEYLRSINAEFEKITLIEDILYNVKVFQNTESLNILDIALYNYKRRMNESLTNKFVKDYYELHRKRVKMIYDQYIDWNMCDDNVKTVLADIYSRYIFSALQRNCDKRSQMSHTDRVKWLEALFDDDLWRELSDYVTVNLSFQGILSGFLKCRRKGLCLISGRFIFVVKEILPMVFAKAKKR